MSDEEKKPGLLSAIDPKTIAIIVTSLAAILGSCATTQHQITEKVEEVRVEATAYSDSVMELVDGLDRAISEIQTHDKKQDAAIVQLRKTIAQLRPEPARASKPLPRRTVVPARAPAKPKPHGFGAFWKKLGFLGGIA